MKPTAEELKEITSSNILTALYLDSVKYYANKKPMNLIVIQARMGSTRLPGKVMKILKGKPVLQHIIERCLQVNNADKVMVATTYKTEDDCIVKLCDDLTVACYRGSELDVLDRYYACANMCDATNIIRITGDCPVIDYKLIEHMIASHNGHDLTTNGMSETFPDGEDVEVIARSVLRDAWDKATLKKDREHVTTWIKDNYILYDVCNVYNKINLSTERWTLDELEDLKFIEILYNNLYDRNPYFGIYEIMDFLKKCPEIRQINSHIIRNAGYLKSLKEEGLI